MYVNVCQMSPWKCGTSHLYCVYISASTTHTSPDTSVQQWPNRGTIEPCLERSKGRKEVSERRVRRRSERVVSREREGEEKRWKQ